MLFCTVFGYAILFPSIKSVHRKEWMTMQKQVLYFLILKGFSKVAKMILRKKKNEQECFLCFLYEGNLLCQILIVESHCVFLYALHTGADLKFFYGIEFQ